MLRVDVLYADTINYISTHILYTVAIKPNMNQDYFSDYCPVNTTLTVISGKWKGLIVYHLIDGKKRFNELHRRLPKISQRMLTLQLRELESDGLIHREVYPIIPPKVEYSLTVFSQTLLPVVYAMHDWGVKYANECERIKQK